MGWTRHFFNTLTGTKFDKDGYDAFGFNFPKISPSIEVFFDFHIPAYCSSIAIIKKDFIQQLTIKRKMKSIIKRQII